MCAISNQQCDPANEVVYTVVQFEVVYTVVQTEVNRFHEATAGRAYNVCPHEDFLDHPRSRCPNTRLTTQDKNGVLCWYNMQEERINVFIRRFHEATAGSA